MVKGYEYLVASDTTVDVNTGMIAAGRLQALIESRASGTRIADLMVQMDHIIRAIHSSVPEELWPEILRKIDGPVAVDTPADEFEDWDNAENAGRRSAGFARRFLGRGTDIGPKLACRAQRCNDHELIVVGGQAEAALPQRIPNTKAAVAEEPQIRNPGGDTAGQLPRRARTQIVEGRTVNGDRAYTAVVAGRPSALGRVVRSAARSAGRRPGRWTTARACPRPARDLGDN